MEGIQIRQVKTTEDIYQQVYDLREAILRQPIGLSLADEDLSQDEKDIILAAFSGDSIIGCLMLQHKDAETIKFRQMAVSEGMQGKGIGYMLMNAGEKLSKEQGYTKIVLHAREVANGFYLKSGYRITSELYEEVGIPHYTMEKNIG